MSSVADPARMSGRGGRGRPPEESGAAEEGGAGRARSRADPATSSVARSGDDEWQRRVGAGGRGGRGGGGGQGCRWRRATQLRWWMEEEEDGRRRKKKELRCH